MPAISPEQAQALKTWFAREDVPPELKEQAKVRLREQIGAAPPPAAAAAPAPVAAAPAPTPQPTAPAPEGELRAGPVRSGMRMLFPERGAFGMLGDIVSNPTELGGFVGTTAGLAAASLLAAPETMGASLLLPVLGAGLGGFLGREAGASVEGPHGETVAPGRGRTRSWTERGLSLAMDALPATLGALFRPAVLSEPELARATEALAAGKAAGVKGAERLPAGAKALAKEAATEVAPGVAPGAVGALPAPVPPRVGPQFTKVAQESLRSTEKQAAAHYDAALAKAKALDLQMPPPQHVIRAAGDALEALDRSGLDPTVRDGARKVLESIRDLDVGKLGKGATVGEGGVIEGAVTKEPLPDTVTYADLDAWRQKLQEYAPGFSKLGQAQSFSKGSVGHVLGLVKDEMATLARGTEVEALHQTANDFFVHEVQPARALAKTVLKGEVEPAQLVDVLTGKAHQEKFVRYMDLLDKKAPAQAQAFRQTKFNNMIDRATTTDGTLDPNAFLQELDKIPKQSRRVLLQGVQPNEIHQLMRNLDEAKAFARASSQADTEAALAATQADVVAAHEAAAADFTRAIAEGKETPAFRTAREHAAAQEPVLVNARRKLVSQQMWLEAPVDLMGAGAAMKVALTAGNVYPLLSWMGAGAGATIAHRGLRLMLASPRAIPKMNLIFRLAGAGASPSVLARHSADLLGHLTHGAARAVLGNIPSYEAQANAARRRATR